ncbi:FKBP-type peptidyl-prolyl cis-trans isomerase [Microbacterium sp. OR21]|uniref:FKBP-type peptidyl-prolyl cis-trans isomerase n=1 Tax=Microbacterium sp. OR21 TaxID=3095346 RepID=UPI0039B3A234
MRLRPLTLASTVAVTALLLTGCSGAQDKPEASASKDGADACAQVAAPGAFTDSVDVTGEFGEPAKITVAKDQKVDEVQRTVVTEGDGEKVQEGDYIAYAMSAFDSQTGDHLGDLGYTEGELLPQDALANEALAEAIGCAPVGTRVAFALPAAEGTQSQLYIIDVLDKVPTSAWGEKQAPVEGMPTVKLAKDGEPDVVVPTGDAPDELKISVLKQGDGPAVADGDTTLLQYYGVDWESGDSFDSSWSKGAPYAAPGNTYVPGFVQALAGQKVGSQVLVVIPPELAYGDDPEGHELGGKTLVFVIDILATQHAPAAQ